MSARYPEIEPYEHGMLDVGDGNLVYWEQCGNPAGKPAVLVHGRFDVSGPLDTAWELTRAWPDAELIVVTTPVTTRRA